MTYYYESELYHYGIKGQKWGVRRYQNEDGTLTAEGKERYLNSDGSKWTHEDFIHAHELEKNLSRAIDIKMDERSEEYNNALYKTKEFQEYKKKYIKEMDYAYDVDDDDTIAMAWYYDQRKDPDSSYNKVAKRFEKMVFSNDYSKELADLKLLNKNIAEYKKENEKRDKGKATVMAILSGVGVMSLSAATALIINKYNR